MKKRGFYFLSNDKVFDLTIAFLNSFRKFNSNAQLCFIPYNGDHLNILTLKDRYKFEVFQDDYLLQQCDDISEVFHNNINGAYRKLVMWDGIYDEFAYIDVDTLVLENVNFAFRFLDKYSCLTSHSNLQEIRKFVWKDSIYQTDHLNENQIAFAANTGFIVSKREFMNMDWIKKKMKHALSIKEHMELFCQEQPFLNYLIVTSGKPFTSLHVLFYELKVKKEIMLEKWAGTKEGKIKEGKIYLNYDKPLFLVHWAGLWQPRKVDFLWFKILKYLGLVDKGRAPKLYVFMPYKKLWNYYRNM